MDKYMDNVFNHMWCIWDHQDYFRTIDDCYCSFDQLSVAFYSKKIINQANINNEGDAIIGIYNPSDEITEVSLINTGFKKRNICDLKLHPKNHKIILHNTGLKLVGSSQKYGLETKSDDLIAIYAVFLNPDLRRCFAYDRYNRIMIQYPHVQNRSIEIPVLGIPLEK